MAVDGSEEAALRPPTTSDAPRVGPASQHPIDQQSPTGHQPMSTADEETPKKDALIWNDMEGLAHLPNSDLKFKINELGVLELVEVKENGQKEFMELKDLSVKVNQKEENNLQAPSSPSLLNGSSNYTKHKVVLDEEAETQKIDMDIEPDGSLVIVEMVPVPLSPDITQMHNIVENGKHSESQNFSLSSTAMEIDEDQTNAAHDGDSTQMVDFKMDDVISGGVADATGKQFIKLEFEVESNDKDAEVPINPLTIPEVKGPKIKTEPDTEPDNGSSSDSSKLTGAKTRANSRKMSQARGRKPRQPPKNGKVKVKVEKGPAPEKKEKTPKTPKEKVARKPRVSKKPKQEADAKPALTKEVKESKEEEKVPKVENLDEELEEETIAFCRNCGYFGLQNEFYKSHYCTHSCCYSYNLSSQGEQAPKPRLLANLKSNKDKKSKFSLSRSVSPPMNFSPPSTPKGRKTDSAKSSPKSNKESNKKKELRKRAEMLRRPDTDKKLESGKKSETVKKVDILPSSRSSSPATATSPKVVKKERRMPSLRNETPTRKSLDEPPIIPVPIPIKPIERKLPVFETFDWIKYLAETKAKTAPMKLFRKPALPPPNPFKVGMMLEAIDTQHQSLFCAVVVVEVMGHRLRLRFIGYNENYDFWVNSDSLDIFPCGWCEEHGYSVEPPPDARIPFNWHQYMVEKEAAAAERSFFAITVDEPLPDCGVRVGMKLEAVDVKNANLVCVATATKVLGHRFLVHFDSWDSNYDYWTDCSSPFIHPVGWCEKNNIKLTPPNKLKDDFSWDTYLVSSKAMAMPSRLFQPLPPVGFKKGFKLEAIDKRNPFILRVATVADIDDHKIILHFDGWDSLYDYKVDELSEDLHPVGWAAHTGHTLQPPPLVKDTSVSCPIFGCYGVGHVKGPKFLTHNTDKNCPYAPHNVLKFWEPADRIIVIETIPSSIRPIEPKTEEAAPILKKEPAQVIGRKRPSNSKRGVVVKKRLIQPKPAIKVDTVEDKKPEESPVHSVPINQSFVSPQPEVTAPVRPTQTFPETLQFSSPAQDEVPPYFNTNAGDIKSLVGKLNAETVVKWSIQQVHDFISKINGSHPAKFKEELIDGDAFLMLKQEDLVDLRCLGLKFGPALKVCNAINLIIRNSSSSS